MFDLRSDDNDATSSAHGPGLELKAHAAGKQTSYSTFVEISAEKSPTRCTPTSCHSPIPLDRILSYEKRLQGYAAPRVSIEALDSGKSPTSPYLGPKKLSNNEAIFTIVNLFVGIALLSAPYCAAKAGWSALLGLIMMALWGGMSGLIMIKCFQMIPGSRVTYPQLGMSAGGWVGRLAVQLVITMEFVGAVLIVMLFMWKNFSLLFPQFTQLGVAVGLTIASIPTVWLLNFEEISSISFLGVVSNGVIMLFLLLVLAASFFEKNYKYGETKTYTDTEGVSMCMGIYTVALAGHAALPGVYADMKNKEDINYVVSISFFIMVCVYGVATATGYVLYGSSSHVLVTQDIMRSNPGWCFNFVTGLVVAKSYFTISPVISILFEIPEECLGIKSPTVKRVGRSIAFVGLSAVAYFFQDGLGLVEAFTGSLFTMASSFILPPIFYGILLYREGFSYKVAALGVTAIVAIALASVFTFGDIEEAIKNL